MATLQTPYTASWLNDVRAKHTTYDHNHIKTTLFMNIELYMIGCGILSLKDIEILFNQFGNAHIFRYVSAQGVYALSPPAAVYGLRADR